MSVAKFERFRSAASLEVDRADLRRLDDRVELEPILQGLAQLPILDLAYGEDTPAELPPWSAV